MNSISKHEGSADAAGIAQVVGENTGHGNVGSRSDGHHGINFVPKAQAGLWRRWLELKPGQPLAAVVEADPPHNMQPAHVVLERKPA